MARRRKQPATVERVRYESESELCSQFIDHARSKGFKVYCETADFDLLLVVTPEVLKHTALFTPGEQIGVHAKLLPNVAVLYQALPRARGPVLDKVGPDYYAILVPNATDEFVFVARKLGITVYTASWSKSTWWRGTAQFVTKGTPRVDFGLTDSGFTYKKMEHKERCWTPEVEVNIPAGTKAPVQLTPWKMAAVKLCITGVKKGYLTTQDFADAKISMSRWSQKGWVQPGEWVKENGKRLKSYLLQDDNKPPHLLYPEVVVALEEAGLI